MHGKPFEPDERVRKILEDAVVVGNATARTVTFTARPEEGDPFQDSSPDVVAFVLTFDRLAGSGVVREQPIPAVRHHPFGVMTRSIRAPYAE